MNTKKVVTLILVFVLFLSLCSLLAFLTPTIATTSNTVDTSTSSNAIASTGLVAQIGFELIEPHLLVLGDGTRIYCTSFGNYTMQKDYANRMSFSYRDGTQLITNSLFWVNSTYGGKPLSLSKLPKADITVLVANDTVFEFKHPLKSDSGNIVGNLTVTYHFSKDVRPKLSIVYENQLLSEWQITWCLLPSMTYLKTDETHAEMLSATTTVSFGVKTFVELGDSASPQNWSLWSLTTWEDYGVAIVYGGLEKVLGGKGITVVFPVNETIVDPSIVASASSDAVGPPFQRGLIYSDSGYWFAFYAYNGLKLKTSSDGSAWSSEVNVKPSISFGELFSIWYESGSTIHLVYSDLSNKKLNYSQGTISGSSITWNYNYTAVTFSGTDYCDNPTVAVDSNGYPWLTFANRSTTVSLCIIKASTTTGSSWGTPVTLWSNVQSSSSNVILPLLAGDMYSIAQRDVVDDVYGKRYWASNSSWQTGDGTFISDDDTGYWAYSAVAYGTRLYLTTSYATGGSVHVYKYGGSSWSNISPTVASDNGRNVLTINSTSEDIYLSYGKDDKIYLQKRTNSTSSWATSEVICTTTFSGANFRATMRRWNSQVGILWLGSSYDVIVGILADVYVFSNLTVTPMSCGFGAPLTFSGQLFYQGTTIPPPDGDYNVQVLLSGLSVGSNHTLIGGNWSVSASAPNSNGTYVYTCTASNTPTSGTFSSVAVSDTAPPTFGSFSYNSTVAGTSCLFSGLANDDVNVSGYVFESNITGTVQNTTWTGFSTFSNATAAYCETVQILPSGNGTVPWRFYANDTSNNWAASQIQTLNYSSTATYYIVVFHVSAGGSLYVNGAVTADSSSFNYSSGVQLSLAAVPNIGYGFAGFLWTNGSSATSPIAYSLLANDTVWTYFTASSWPPSPGPGPLPSIQVMVSTHVSASPGQATIFDLTITWQTGIANLTITSISPGGSYSSWITIVDGLPKTGGAGSMTVSLKCTPSWDAQLGQANIPCTLGVQPVGGSASTASGTIVVTVVSAQEMGLIPEILTIVFLLVAIAVGLYGYIRRLLHH